MIVMHHIGGRNGTYPFPIKTGNLLKDIHLVLYDADPKCLDHMQFEGAKGNFTHLTILPYLIGEKSSTLKFNITFHPTNSSIYELNPEFVDFHTVHYPRYGEYRLGNAFASVKALSLEAFSLKDALDKSNIKVLDVLTLDVQGAEFEIINGSKNLIRDECLCIQLEVEFIELYKDQKVFPSLHTLLQSLNFELIDLNSISRISPCSLPIGFRGKEMVSWGEAVYLKNFNSIEKEEDINKIAKWTFFAFIHQQMGLCMKGLKLLDEKSYFNGHMKTSNAYFDVFLQKVWKIFKEADTLFLPKFHELFTETMIQNFYQIEDDKVDCSEDQKRIAQYLSSAYKSNSKLVQQILSSMPTKLETLCLEYNLNEVAETLKANRLRDASFFIALCPHLER